jgi:hypothetical protein
VIDLDEEELRRHQADSTERVNLRLKLHVEVGGIDPYEIDDWFWVKTSRLTDQGQELPVAVDPKKPQRIAIDWTQPPAGIGGDVDRIEIDQR